MVLSATRELDRRREGEYHIRTNFLVESVSQEDCDLCVIGRVM